MHVYNVVGECVIMSPAGTVRVSVSKGGVVYVDGSRTVDNWRWYLDQLKAAREAIKTGKAPQGFRVGGSEPVANKRWYLTMFKAASDAVFRDKPDSSVIQHTKGKEPIPLGNGLVLTQG